MDDDLERIKKIGEIKGMGLRARELYEDMKKCANEKLLDEDYCSFCILKEACDDYFMRGLDDDTVNKRLKSILEYYKIEI